MLTGFPSFPARSIRARAASRSSIRSSTYRVSRRFAMRDGSSSPHAAEPRGQHPRAATGPLALGPLRVRAACGHERLERPLEDPLRADVDPRSGGHLPVHREPEVLEPSELVPVGPLADEVRVGDEHAGGVGVRAELADGLPRLDEQRLVIPERAQLAHDHVERGPVARSFPGAAVNDQILRSLGDLGIEVVVQHAEGRLLDPPLARNLGAAGRSQNARFAHGESHSTKITAPRSPAVRGLALPQRVSRYGTSSTLPVALRSWMNWCASPACSKRNVFET